MNATVSLLPVEHRRQGINQLSIHTLMDHRTGTRAVLEAPNFRTFPRTRMDLLRYRGVSYDHNPAISSLHRYHTDTWGPSAPATHSSSLNMVTGSPCPTANEAGSRPPGRTTGASRSVRATRSGPPRPGGEPVRARF